MKKFLIQITAVCIIYFIVTHAEQSVIYASDAIDMCFGIIIPTLFPFFICSGLLIYSGFCETLARVFRFCMRPLFKVSPMGASAFVIGIISGYPLGAITAGELYKNNYITKTEAERLLAFCNNSGPLFILGSVGLAMYSELKYGIILYVCHILAAIAVGIIFRFYKRNDYMAPETVMTSPPRSGAEIFSIALNNAVSSMLTVCGAVVFFSVASRIVISHIPLQNAFAALVSGICEFVTGSVQISSLDMPLAQRLVLTAFVVGFAGSSVHIQVLASVAKYELSMKPYIIGKLLHGIIAAIFTYLYMCTDPITSAVFKTSINKSFTASASCGITTLIIIAVICTAIKLLGKFNLIKPRG